MLCQCSGQLECTFRAGACQKSPSWGSLRMASVRPSIDTPACIIACRRCAPFGSALMCLKSACCRVPSCQHRRNQGGWGGCGSYRVQAAQLADALFEFIQLNSDDLGRGANAKRFAALCGAETRVVPSRRATPATQVRLLKWKLADVALLAPLLACCCHGAGARQG